MNEKRGWGVRLLGAMLAAVPPDRAREMIEELLWETGHRLRQWRRGHETAVNLAEAAAVALVQGYHYPRPAGLACPKCRMAGVKDQRRHEAGEWCTNRHHGGELCGATRAEVEAFVADALNPTGKHLCFYGRPHSFQGTRHRRTYVPPKVAELGKPPTDGHCHNGKCEETLHAPAPGACGCVCKLCVIANVCGSRAPVRPADASDTTPAPAPDEPPPGAPDWRLAPAKTGNCAACGHWGRVAAVSADRWECADTALCLSRAAAFAASNATRQN